MQTDRTLWSFFSYFILIIISHVDTQELENVDIGEEDNLLGLLFQDGNQETMGVDYAGIDELFEDTEEAFHINANKDDQKEVDDMNTDDLTKKFEELMEILQRILFVYKNLNLDIRKNQKFKEKYCSTGNTEDFRMSW